jgi:hypothetical protein
MARYEVVTVAKNSWCATTGQAVEYQTLLATDVWREASERYERELDQLSRMDDYDIEVRANGVTVDGFTGRPVFE